MLRFGRLVREQRLPGYWHLYSRLREEIVRGRHRALEQLVGTKSFEQVWEIQYQYAKKAFDSYVAQASKLGEMYGDLARSAYQPVEQAAAKTARKVA